VEEFLVTRIAGAIRLILRKISPMMTPMEIAIIDATLRSMSEPVRVFEYGAGISTIYFPQTLEGTKKYTWDSVESSRDWHGFLNQRLLENKLNKVNVHLVDFSTHNLKEQSLPEGIRNEYVGKLTNDNSKFDIVLIDGRFRRRSLVLARQMQIATGIIFLLDAERPYYLDGYKDAQYGIMLYTGISPFQKRTKKKYMWVGFKTPEMRKKFQNNFLDKIDMQSLVHQS